MADRTNEDAVADFERASERVKRMAADGVGPLASRNGAEARYGVTYGELVRRGLKPALRAKYRVG